VYVKIWPPPLDFGSDFEVGCSWQIGMDPSLHAHLGGPRVPRLGGPVADLLQRQRVRVGVCPPLRERAEPAAGIADVGEVDVASDDIGDVVAHGFATECVGDSGQGLQVRAVRGQQGERLGIGEGERVAFGLAEGGAYLPDSQDGGRGLDGGTELDGGRGLDGGAGSLGGGTQHGPFCDLIPIAVDLSEIIPAVMGAAGGIDGHVQVGAAGFSPLTPAAVGFLPGQAARHGAVGGQAGGGIGERGHVPG